LNRSLKKALKFVLYLAAKIAAAAAIVYLVYFSFMTVMNTMNINVMVKDGFTKRASVILQPLDNKDTALLEKVFTRDYLDRTGLDIQEDNRFYDVSMFMQRTDVKIKVVRPKQEEAIIEVTDIVDDIRATLINENDPSFVEKSSLIGSGKYEVRVVKTEDGWMIDDIKLIESITPEYIRPLPTKAPQVVSEEIIEEEEIEITDGEEVTE